MTTNCKKASLAILFTISFLSGVFSGGVLASADMQHSNMNMQEHSRKVLTNNIELPEGYDSLVLSLLGI